MHFQAFLLFCGLPGFILADPVTYAGSASTFLASNGTTSGPVTAQIYKSCTEVDVNGNMVSQGSVCVARAVGCIFSTLATIGANSVEILNSTASILQPTSNQKRQYRGAVIDRVNGPLQTAGKLPVRALQILPSSVHTDDGIAIRTNVDSDGSMLHVHTNGTHALAIFQRSTALSPRSYTNTSLYSFTGVSGLKVQATWSQVSNTNAKMADMEAFGFGFAYGNGFGAAFQQSDVWNYAVCEVPSNPIFQGKLISEREMAGLNYEPGALQTCE